MSRKEAQPVVETGFDRDVSGPLQVKSKTIQFRTEDRVSVMRITEPIRELVQLSGIQDGLVHVSSTHTTVALLVNEFQAALMEDVKGFMERLIARNGWYKHNSSDFSDCERGNADAHLRAIFLGGSVSLPIRGSALHLGTWQDILLLEFDGPQERRINVQVLGV